MKEKKIEAENQVENGNKTLKYNKIKIKFYEICFGIFICIFIVGFLRQLCFT